MSYKFISDKYNQSLWIKGNIGSEFEQIIYYGIYNIVVYIMGRFTRYNSVRKGVMYVFVSI